MHPGKADNVSLHPMTLRYTHTALTLQGSKTVQYSPSSLHGQEALKLTLFNPLPVSQPQHIFCL